MGIITYSLLISALLLELSNGENLTGQICYIQKSRGTSYNAGWWRTGYKRVTYRVAECCDGWTGKNCSDAICDGKSDPNTSCSIEYSNSVRYKNGSIQHKSGGKCVSPNCCVQCNEGFYPYNISGNCRECSPRIPNCNLNVCERPDDVECHFCVNEWETKTPFKGQNEFTAQTGNETTTKRTCQRSCAGVNGYICYPGSCDDKYLRFHSCRCAQGFGGTNCANATSPYGIEVQHQSLLFGSCGKDGHCDPPVMLESSKKVWTNLGNSTGLEISIIAEYVIPTVTPPPYINNDSTKVELKSIRAVVIAERGTSQKTWSRTSPCDTITICSLNDTTLSLSNMGLSNIENGFEHGDRIFYTVYPKNGGIVSYKKLDGNHATYDIVGIEKQSDTFELEIDLQDPQHCYEVSDACLLDSLTTHTDFLKEGTLNMGWSGWSDNDSDLKEFHITMYKLVNLKEGELVQGTSIVAESILMHPNISATLPVTEIGPYAVELSAYDHAGNHKTTRRIFMFDNTSHVTLHEQQSRVTNANAFGWITEDNGYIEIAWPDRFANNLHNEQCWLCKVLFTGSVVTSLDDTMQRSERSIEAIKNIKGIVRFEIGFNETYDGSVNFTDYSIVPQNYFDEQRMVFEHLAHSDGKRIEFYIKAYDVMGSYGEDKATIWIDKSPPIIDNLWLTKGDMVNISVHNVTELEDLIIEWVAYDVHSGMHQMSWKLFDNFTNAVIVHGHNYVSPQGETQSEAECESNYGTFARGPNCYCTPFNACYHRHFQVKPKIDADENENSLDGLHELRASGQHESDYFIEVTAINNAGLQTVVHHKITIDTSPPHAGHVHDGIENHVEVDFQQTLTISAHWDGFFDKESGVWFYMYGFTSACLTKEDLVQENPSPGVYKTYSTSETFNAPSEGTYFVTVVAYNHALDQSEPVCSDGVIIDSTPAVVSEVVIHGAIVAPVLLTDTSAGAVYVLQRNRELLEVKEPTQECMDNAHSVENSTLSLYPFKRDRNGTVIEAYNVVCEQTYTSSAQLMTFVTTDSYLDLSWNVTTGPSGVYDFEIGISTEYSEVPNALPFASTRHHAFMRLYHPGIWDGNAFYILIRALSKSAVSDIKIIGPCTVVKAPPEFDGSISVRLESTGDTNYLIAEWEQDDFIDHGDVNDLEYFVALGSSVHDTDVLPFSKINKSDVCAQHHPPTCAALCLDSLHWDMHDTYDYYVTIKAVNTIGLFVLASSDKYTHYSEIAADGVVYDVDPYEDRMFLDIDDIDFQSEATSLSARWFGFETVHSAVRFTICIKNANETYEQCEYLGDRTKHTFSGITLTPYKQYYQHVTAMTDSGNVTFVSDGVMVVIEGDYHQIEIFDGPGCRSSNSGNNTIATSHHMEFVDLCEEDREYQASTNAIHAHWTIPEDKAVYMQDIFWAIEERAAFVDHWTIHQDFQHLKSRDHLQVANLFLTAGRRYRIVLKTCAKQFCFEPEYTNGVTISPNPPLVKPLAVHYNETKQELTVTMERFVDTDIEDKDEAADVIHHYEWAITDDAVDAQLITQWNIANISSTSSYMVEFHISLDGDIDFTKCWNVAVKGLTKAGLSATTSREIRNCSNIQEVRPRFVIDALPENVLVKDDQLIGGSVYLEENAIWDKADIDYTPYIYIISAVWPALRHGRYDWAVIVMMEEDPMTFYKSTTNIALKQPCSHPEAIMCGTSEKNFMNAEIPDNVLTHGKRCIVCIHANATTLYHELWPQELEDVSTCSDGVTVDLTAPEPADVWIGTNKSHYYQTSLSDIIVYWDSFIDVEEEKFALHQSGITKYMVAIGTTPGGNDVAGFMDVGVTNHKTVHGIALQNGHSYFATVKGYDFIGRSSVGVSHQVTADTTPPILTRSTIHLKNKHIRDTSFVSACWKNVFADPESGISHYFWSIGTNHGYEDVMLYTYSPENCAETLSDAYIHLKDGHAYFITVKAYNFAGLFTTYTSWAFMVDTTPPSPGMVYDGYTVNQYRDADFLTDTGTFEAHWTPFTDPHTTVKEYFISIGSCPNCDDILTVQSVGITLGANLTMLPLAEGIRYYTTVTACNTADLCSTSTSDGFVVDKTPPIAGRVIDGLGGSDHQYQSSKTHVGCKWYGFTDPQSGIARYVWRLGLAKGDDDLIPATNVHLLEEAYIVDMETTLGHTLPVGKTVYCTVRAYNGAGKYTEVSSNGFIVDSTAPSFHDDLKLSPVGTIVPNTLITRSSLKVQWDVDDPESSIRSQYLSLSSHIGGDFNLSSIKVEAIIRDYTFAGLKLHDGSYYDVKLVSCNGANLCTDSTLNDILVDSTPPSPGTFAVDTDHASVLNRQPGGWMKWDTLGLNLAWIGFEDMHSGISAYVINAGSSYMGNDLNKDSSSQLTVDHSHTGFDHSEGIVQTYKVDTKSLAKQKHVYVSIFAVNKVGLRSAILHSKFNLLFGGMLELVRRCDADTCLGHCICAPFDHLCYVSTNNCSTDIGGHLDLFDIVDVQAGSAKTAVQYSPVDTYLAASWNPTSGVAPLWYEWSVGESTNDEPMGIFDSIKERVWHDAGTATDWIYGLPRGKSLKWNHRYSFYVRVWYSATSYRIYKSQGVTILSRPPLSTNIRGVSVKEVVGNSFKDVDFVSRTSPMSADWAGKFVGNSTSKYHIYISTHPGGNDIQVLSTDIVPTTTKYNMTGLHLQDYTKYFIVVQAFNYAGLHSTESSDGFIIDPEPPIVGIVNDGKALTDIKYLNTTYRMETFWYGFSDIGSGIDSYEHCISTPKYQGRCDIHPAIDVGLSTAIEISTSVELNQGGEYINEVRARDMAGQFLPFKSSNGVLIDRTPPVRVLYNKNGANLIHNPSFEDTKIVNTSACKQILDLFWELSDSACAILTELSNAPDGKYALNVQGSILQSLNISKAGKYVLEFYTSYYQAELSQLSSIEGFVQIGANENIFLMHEKPYSGDNIWQRHFFKFELTNGLHDLKFSGARTYSSFGIDLISLKILEWTGFTDKNIDDNHLAAFSVFSNDWSSIHSEWNFEDPESGITEYLWGVGTVVGGTQLQDFKSVGLQTSSYSNSLNLVHNTQVYVTVVAVNGAGLRTVSHSTPVQIDLTPPTFHFIHDANHEGEDVDFQTHLVVSAVWSVSDPESGIDSCLWALGTSKYGTSIQDFVLVDKDQSSASVILNSEPADVIYTTVRCINGAGLSFTSSSDGLKILNTSLSDSEAFVEIMAASTTQYKPIGMYHGNPYEVKFRWTGFKEDEGINNYVISIAGQDVSYSEIVVASTSGFNYAMFTGITLPDGLYEVDVRAVNEIKMYSQRKTTEFFLLSSKPTLMGPAITTSWNAAKRVASASWSNVFQSSYPLYYEVSVRQDGGEGDLVQWQETTNEMIEVDVDETNIPANGATLQFSVRAINHSGYFETTYRDLFVSVNI